MVLLDPTGAAKPDLSAYPPTAVVRVPALRADVFASHSMAAMEANYHGWAHGFALVMMGAHQAAELVPERTNRFICTNPETARHFARVTFSSPIPAPGAAS